MSKYQDLPGHYIFQPVSLENLGSVSSSTSAFLTEVGRRISRVSGDPREGSFLRQRISICIQRFNAVILGYSFVADAVTADE